MRLWMLKVVNFSQSEMCISVTLLIYILTGVQNLSSTLIYGRDKWGSLNPEEDHFIFGAIIG
jgi:hypothetical protein